MSTDLFTEDVLNADTGVEFVITVYDYDSSARQELHDVLNTHGLSLTGSLFETVVEATGSVAAIRTDPLEDMSPEAAQAIARKIITRFQDENAYTVLSAQRVQLNQNHPVTYQMTFQW